MKLANSLSTRPVLGVLAVIFLGLQLRFPKLSVSDPRYLNPPPDHLEHFTFGFHQSVSDTLWLRWVQDSDACQTYGVKSRLDYKPSDDPLFKNPRHRTCDNSWAFKMLDAITRLDPKFKMPYLLGAVSLSVVVEDYDGATVIFDRGVAHHPDDWSILYRAAYHYQFDRQDPARAAELLTEAAKHGGPWWLPLMAARLQKKVGQLELGIRTLAAHLERLKEGEREHDIVARRLSELKAEYDEQMRLEKSSSQTTLTKPKSSP